MKLPILAVACLLLSVSVALSSADEASTNGNNNTCVAQSKCPFMKCFKGIKRVFTLHFWKRHYYKMVHGKDIGACDPSNCQCATEEDTQACLKAGHDCHCTKKPAGCGGCGQDQTSNTPAPRDHLKG